MTQEIRWHYRFENFSRAFSRLENALESERESLSELEQEGVIQRFEYTYELAWKLLRDRLKFDGIALPAETPRHVIKAAFTAKLIDDGDAWVDMMNSRNEMSHEYDADKFEETVDKIHFRYLAILDNLHQKFNTDIKES